MQCINKGVIINNKCPVMQGTGNAYTSDTLVLTSGFVFWHFVFFFSLIHLYTLMSCFTHVVCQTELQWLSRLSLTGCPPTLRRRGL